MGFFLFNEKDFKKSTNFNQSIESFKRKPVNTINCDLLKLKGCLAFISHQ